MPSNYYQEIKELENERNKFSVKHRWAQERLANLAKLGKAKAENIGLLALSRCDRAELVEAKHKIKLMRIENDIKMQIVESDIAQLRYKSDITLPAEAEAYFVKRLADARFERSQIELEADVTKSNQRWRYHIWSKFNEPLLHAERLRHRARMKRLLIETLLLRVLSGLFLYLNCEILDTAFTIERPRFLDCLKILQTRITNRKRRILKKDKMLANEARK